jgi:hypothetical protein
LALPAISPTTLARVPERLRIEAKQYKIKGIDTTRKQRYGVSPDAIRNDNQATMKAE